MSALMQRILTALLLAPLVVAGLLWLQPTLLAIVLGLVLLPALWEWGSFIGDKPSPSTSPSQSLRLPFFALGTLLLLAIYFLPLAQLEWLLWLALLFWGVAFKRLLSYPTRLSLLQSSRYGRFVTGLLVLLPAWAGVLVLLRHPLLGSYYLLLLLLIIWGADIGAYFAGRRWGRHKLASAVSPGKSIEGAVGGWLLAMLVAALFASWMVAQQPISMPPLFSLLLIVAVIIPVSIVGDLFESMYKRIVGVKDSGHILPGHGGVLDRIDSFTAAAPLFTLALLVTLG
ncbi:MAG: phosphatidate cytidylyltransferase [Gammaproteobacteria bacterium]|nr:phosphatidate cytidylyltransferase [Gammaproteobacteria bacterium]